YWLWPWAQEAASLPCNRSAFRPACLTHLGGAQDRHSSEGENGRHAPLWRSNGLLREASPMNGLNRKTRLIAAAITSAAAMFLVAAPSASAGVLVKSATNCTTPPLEQPFTHWGDNSSYVPAPQGS